MVWRDKTVVMKPLFEHPWVRLRRSIAGFGFRGRAICWVMILMGSVFPVSQTGAANLVARWKLDESGAIHADAGPNGVSLIQDATTTPAISTAGIKGAAVQLGFQNPPGVSTRLAATGAPLQRDSFGFSFWLNPVFLNEWDNLIAKEMAFNNSVPGFSRIAWQVHLLANNGSGAAALELLVRGDDRGAGDFYGTVVSTTNLPLQSSSAAWVHVAGGYDSTTGALRLYVNGVESVSNNSSPGAQSSDGGAFSIGTARNGADFVAFAAGARVEDVQLYDGPLTAPEAALLNANPGQALRSFLITQFTPDVPSGDLIVQFNTLPGCYYQVKVGVTPAILVGVTNLSAHTESSAVIISKAMLDGALGPAPRAQVFVRVQEYGIPPGFAACE